MTDKITLTIVITLLSLAIYKLTTLPDDCYMAYDEKVCWSDDESIKRNTELARSNATTKRGRR